MRTTESIFELLSKNWEVDPVLMNKTPELRNEKSKIYKNRKGACVNRYKQFNKICCKLLKEFLRNCGKTEKFTLFE